MPHMRHEYRDDAMMLAILGYLTDFLKWVIAKLIEWLDAITRGMER